MKELLLQAVLDAGTCGITPPALCRWLIALTGGPVEGATGNARKFYHTPCPDVLEIWFQDTLSQQAENVICYSRISFRPLLPASAATSSTATDCRIAVEVLPPEQIYTSIPLSEMGLVGASPRLVAVDGWVVPHGSLSRGPMGSLNRAHAVLTPALTARLGVSFHTEQQAAVSVGPYDVLRQEVERLLSLCFPGGGEVEGCPLHVSLRLNEVSADCLLNTNADHRLLRFGSSGEGSAPRSAFPLYGARQPGRYRYLNITMLYPRGELETARRLFQLFAPTASLMAVEPVGDVDRWVPYDVDDHAVDTLTQALYHQSGMDAPGVGRLYCLLTPSGSVAGTLLRQQLSVRLRRLVRSLGAFYWGPVPLHAIGGRLSADTCLRWPRVCWYRWAVCPGCPDALLRRIPISSSDVHIRAFRRALNLSVRRRSIMILYSSVIAISASLPNDSRCSFRNTSRWLTDVFVPPTTTIRLSAW